MAAAVRLHVLALRIVGWLACALFVRVHSVAGAVKCFQSQDHACSHCQRPNELLLCSGTFDNMRMHGSLLCAAPLESSV